MFALTGLLGGGAAPAAAAASAAARAPGAAAAAGATAGSAWKFLGLTGGAALGGATAAAAAGLGAAYLSADHFASENGGWGGAGAFLGIGSETWGFDGVNDYMNAQARQEAAARQLKATAPTGKVDTSALPPSWAMPQIDATSTNEQLRAFTDATAYATEQLKKINVTAAPNRGDKPDGVK